VPDPYATTAPDLSGRPAGPAPWLELVRGRGGAPVAPDGDFPAEAGFLTIDCRGIGTLAPFARVDPALAALLWIEHSAGGSAVAAEANSLHERLRGFGRPLYAIKQGSVAGPDDRPGCLHVGEELIAAVLEAVIGRTVTWETDPDFGYEVPAAVPGLDEALGRALLPRLLYADNDRVYEHAGLVAAKKRERAGIATSIAGLDLAISSASGWPPIPSPTDWRD
jgi:hypothetical protein